MGRTFTLAVLMVGWASTASLSPGQSALPVPSNEVRPMDLGPEAGPVAAPTMLRPYQLPNTMQDFPSGEVREVPGARANAVAARQEWQFAQRDVEEYVRRAEQDFNISPELTEARQNEELAQAKLAMVRSRLLRPLMGDERYLELTAQRDQITEQIANEHALPKPNGAHIAALARLKLDFSTMISTLEQQALLGSEELASAQRDVVEAGRRISALKADFQRAMQRDPQLAGLRERMRERQVAALASQAYLESAVRARNIAIDYAAYLHRDTRYVYQQRPYEVRTYDVYGTSDRYRY